MASTKELKSRINSINNTSKITKAMEMISAVKMQKSLNSFMHSKPYSEGVYQMVQQIGVVEDYDHIYLKKSEEISKVAIVVIGTSRGFVGGLLSNLTATCFNLKSDLTKKYPNSEVVGISVFKTAQRILVNAGINNELHFAKFVDNPTTTDLSSIFQLLTEKFATGEYQEIHLVYTQFINTLEQTTVDKKLLPLGLKTNSDTSEELKSFKFEPNTQDILDFLLPEYFQSQFFSAVLETIASEHSARMIAMKSATDNANELKETVELKYNRERQAGITNEIIDVINGSLGNI